MLHMRAWDLGSRGGGGAGPWSAHVTHNVRGPGVPWALGPLACVPMPATSMLALRPTARGGCGPCCSGTFTCSTPVERW